MSSMPVNGCSWPRISHYTVLSRLGSGGMGEVFLAHDEQLDRKVAIKRIRQEAARPHQRERFRREARLAARLNHPNIVHVYDLLSGEDVDHLVLEYVEGTTLRAMVRQGPLSVSRVVDLGLQIAEGLQEAHRHGIVHRDLKTENVLITDADQTKIADFGIAKLMTDEGLDEDSLTRTGAVLGTYRAMSPRHFPGRCPRHLRRRDPEPAPRLPCRDLPRGAQPGGWARQYSLGRQPRASDGRLFPGGAGCDEGVLTHRGFNRAFNQYPVIGRKEPV